MYRPAWKKPSLPADHIVNRNKGRGKESNNAEPHKSREVLKLERILQDMKTRSGLDKDSKGGCYCLARMHNLSTYTPLCRSCGLILCSINLPYNCCPDCLSPLTTPTSRDALIAKLESEIGAMIQKETEAKERAGEEARQAAGSFPALPSSASMNQPTSLEKTTRSNQTHKVMSLGGNNRRVLVASYTPKLQPVSSTPETVDIEPLRVFPPPPPPLTDRKPTPSRPFENFIHGSITYQPKYTAMDSDARATSKSAK